MSVTPIDQPSRWQIETRYQAIVDARETALFGLEALSRGSEGPWHNAEALFSEAYRSGQLLELELECCERACQHFAGGPQQKLFINVHGIVLDTAAFQQCLINSVSANPRLDPSQVVLELSERCPESCDSLVKAIDQLRAQGFFFAIDDFGVGDSGLLRWSRLRPEFVKLDRQLIHGISVSPDKMAFLKGIQNIAQSLGCTLIAEGVESGDDASTLVNAGIRYLQGYYFHRPGPAPALGELTFPSRVDNVSSTDLYRDVIGHLVRENPVIEPTLRMDAVISQFLAEPRLNSLPVVRDAKVLGVLSRHRTLELYSQDFGRELYGRKPAHLFMSDQATLFDAGASLESVSYQLTDKPGDELPQEFIVCRQGDYLGVVRTGDLLRSITDRQLRNARHANPLTLLPGNVVIAEKIEALLKQGSAFRIAYCDLNHFKAFNDVYGYAQGDAAIKILAQCIREQCNTDLDFIGHVGGDDFIVLFRSAQAGELCRAICEQFGSRIRRLYDRQALTRGGIVTTDREGQRRFYPLMSLAIGLCQPASQALNSALEVSALASAAKKRAKQLPDGGVYECRHVC